MAWALSKTLKSSFRASFRSSFRSSKEAKKDASKVQIVVLGERNVGKSAILSQFLQGKFEEKYRPTVDDFHRHMFQMEDGTYRMLNIIDTAGPYDFPAMQRLWVQQSSGFVVVYSVADEKSFQSAKYLLQLITDIKQRPSATVGLRRRERKDFSIVLVGNKADCPHDERVSREAVRALSAKYGCLYIETSAKYGLNVESIFRCLLMKEVPPRLPHCVRAAQECDVVRPTLLCAKKKYGK